MSCWVYILELCNGHYYIGSTTNISQRYLDHSSGKSPYTRKFIPVKLVFKKEVDNLSIALKLEKRLKKFKNKNILLKIINSQTLKLNS